MEIYVIVIQPSTPASGVSILATALSSVSVKVDFLHMSREKLLGGKILDIKNIFESLTSGLSLFPNPDSVSFPAIRGWGYLEQYLEAKGGFLLR